MSRAAVNRAELHRAVVIGVGNAFRRDDGVGPAVLDALASRGVEADLVSLDAEPTRLMDAWRDRPLAVIVDAVKCVPSHPGRVHRAEDVPIGGSQSTHGLGVGDALRLAQVIGHAPDRVVLFGVEGADTGYGVGLTPRVRRAVGKVVAAVLAELGAELDGTLRPTGDEGQLVG